MILVSKRVFDSFSGSLTGAQQGRKKGDRCVRIQRLKYEESQVLNRVVWVGDTHVEICMVTVM
jgi:hypothetical protein